MSKTCKRCGSYAINHHCHGRDGSDDDLCDVCYWRSRAEAKVAKGGTIASVLTGVRVLRDPYLQSRHAVLSADLYDAVASDEGLL